MMARAPPLIGPRHSSSAPTSMDVPSGLFAAVADADAIHAHLHHDWKVPGGQIVNLRDKAATYEVHSGDQSSERAPGTPLLDELLRSLVQANGTGANITVVLDWCPHKDAPGQWMPLDGFWNGTGYRPYAMLIAAKDNELGKRGFRSANSFEKGN
ncbi:unnamed protein product [Peniophora sp. CBMAI 1063]|nr:unnamed protein product [Peniophora sp. CBMAI 1063]